LNWVQADNWRQLNYFATTVISNFSQARHPLQLDSGVRTRPVIVAVLDAAFVDTRRERVSCPFSRDEQLALRRLNDTFGAFPADHDAASEKRRFP